MMDFYLGVLVISGITLLTGVFCSMFLFLMYVTGENYWQPTFTAEVLFPLTFCGFVAVNIATLGIPYLLFLLYKCRKLFWRRDD